VETLNMEQVATTTAIAEYSQTAAALADLATRYQGVKYDVTQKSGMDAARKARAELRTLRVALEAKRVEIKAPVLQQARLIDSEAHRITAALVQLEGPIDDQIKAEERRIEAEREAKIRAEQERVAAEERARKAAEEAALEAERQRLAAETKRLDEAREKMEAERRAQQEKADAEDRERRRLIAAEEEAARRRIAEQEEQARKERQAEEDRLKAERDKLDAARRAEEDRQHQARLAAERAAEEQARAEREAREEKERAALAAAQELMDAREMLISFKERFGHLVEYETVVAEIEAVLGVLA
jgi:colicin import membrane protein